ncbi:hypothetical protein [Sporosarcina aquimarina]|uniref:Competence protein ComGE n=1 Tax=Sporosarcina aquimarina TaxID=114975 RepID=A0ABU4FZU3_9BACL|nr:hypothetical protein [Sporosarcina aquimarina]MDW0108937.1 hypothetical protein [Sporosarcina aquimarina]
MNESGYSWPETILTLTIMMVVFSTLLPLSFQMLAGLENKKQDMRAKETMYQAAILYTNYGITNGLRKEDAMEYSWFVDGERVCVKYLINNNKSEVCTS